MMFDESYTFLRIFIAMFLGCLLADAIKWIAVRFYEKYIKNRNRKCLKL